MTMTAIGIASASFVHGIGDDSNIYEFNANTGTSTLIHVTGLSSSQANAVAWDETRGNMFFRSPSGGNLYAWNRSTNTQVNLGDPGGGTSNATFGNDAYWYVLDGTDDLYSTTFTYDANGVALSLSTSLAKSNFDGAQFSSFNFGDIAFRAQDNSIYGSSGQGLWKYDIGAQSFQVLNANFNQLRQIAFSSDGNTLYAHNHNDGGWFTIDTTTWTESVLGNPQFKGAKLRDIGNASASSAVPEPGTISMIGFAGLLLLAGRWHRRKS